MITIRMDTRKLKLTVEGHAMGYESSEMDAVAICNMVSALAQGLAYSISRDEEKLKSVEYRPGSGDLMLRVFAEGPAEDRVREKFENYADGMQLLAESHPCSVTMIRDGARITAEEEKE